MSSTVTDGYILKILQRGLEKQYKEALADFIVEETLKEYEVKIRQAIAPVIESLVIKEFNKYKDYADLRDELHIVVHVRDKNGLR